MTLGESSMAIPKPVTIFWFRRDLRLEDNVGLHHALTSGHPVLPLFIFDSNILNELDDRTDARVTFIHKALSELQTVLVDFGSSLFVECGRPAEVFRRLLADYEVAGVVANHDYEPYALGRDSEVAELLRDNNIGFSTFKDQVVFENREVAKDDGQPYTVFTPYRNKWFRKISSVGLREYRCSGFLNRFVACDPRRIPDLESIGFKPSPIPIPNPDVPEELILNYHKTRDLPGLDGTTRLGVHLRFGTVSVRSLVRRALSLSEAWLNELIWREFFMMILYNFPHVVQGPFKPKFRNVPWRNDEEEFLRWCEGRTGFPIVDAGMRELNTTGFMHNRVRMITAGFLVKDLLIDWRWGEAYFAAKLLDFELASNNGNWQWAAGTGCDAAPYFRVFNPFLQADKFDPKASYIRKWVPEFQEPGYPEPMVDHANARKRALKAYKESVDGYPGNDKKH